MKTLPQIILPRMTLVLEYGDKFHCLFYTWDPSSKHVRSKTGKFAQFVRLTMIYSILYIIGQMVSILANRKSASFMELFQGSISSGPQTQIMSRCWIYSAME